VPVLEQVFEQNPEKVKIVFKNFPIRGHAFAIKAAQAALAADSQGKFWAFHDLLFKSYNALNDGKIEEIRAKLGLDAGQFQTRLNDPQVLAQINAEASLGRKLGVRGTPTVFVNGRRLKDRSPIGFKAAVNEALQNLQEKK
jgi:protein-disulfide isomerase